MVMVKRCPAPTRISKGFTLSAASLRMLWV